MAMHHVRKPAIMPGLQVMVLKMADFAGKYLNVHKTSPTWLETEIEIVWVSYVPISSRSLMPVRIRRDLVM